jgi:hypothetical protein
MTKVAILQSNYIPWKGYFDMIRMSDVFVIYDSVQYTKNDWRNRNLIKMKDGLHWLTIPVSVKSLSTKISEVTVANNKWANKHVATLKQTYSRAPYFSMFEKDLEELYSELSHLDHLSDINFMIIEWVCHKLSINTKLTKDSDLNITSVDRVDKLVEICNKFDARTYLSGPSASDYIDESKFSDMLIELEWINYSGYPEYPQLYGEFEHGVSILDVLFNLGDNALDAFEKE